jgi:RNA polymerase sigma factor (sigma-70 family)
MVLELNIDALHLKASKGCKFSEGQLFEFLSVRFQLFTNHRIWNSQDAEEVAQNAMMVVLKEYKNLKVEVSFMSWAYKVLDNKVLSYIKSKKRQAEMESGMPDTDSTLASPKGQDENFRLALLDCLNKVTRTNLRYARILNLHYQGYGTDEICDRLGISSGHFYVLLWRARSMLELCLEKGEV